MASTVALSKSARFPITRIKKIMQSDEDVGKIASGTPVIISRAVELFMKDLIKCAVETTEKTEASNSGAHRLTAQHLKKAITENQTFDFLTDIVEHVKDQPAPNVDDEHQGPQRKRLKAEESLSCGSSPAA